MEASTLFVDEAGVTGGPVVPSVKRRTESQGREDMEPAPMMASFLEILALAMLGWGSLETVL